MNKAARKVEELTLDAPAVTLGVLEGALHLFPQDFGEDGAADSARARLSNVRRPVAARKNSLQRLLDPVRFQREAERISQHHRSAENRSNRIGGVCPGQRRCRTVNGL